MKNIVLKLMKKVSSGHWNNRNNYIKQFEEKLIIFTNFLDKNSSISERFYCIINDIDKPVTCKYCNLPVKFISFGAGYRNFCSVKCSRNSKSTKDKQKKTCIEKYGVDNPQKSISIQKKTQHTKQILYGDKFYTNRKQAEKTCLKKYGIKHYTNRKQAEKTCLKKYGKPYYMIFGSDEWYANMFIKYGVFYSANINGFVDKVKATNRKRYNDENFNNRKKSKQTCLKKYGVDVFLKSEYYRNQMIQLGKYKTPNEQSLLENYYKSVKYFTEKSYNKNKSLFFGMKRGYYLYHLDHICSIIDCFDGNIPPFITGSIVNIALIPWRQNLIKNRNSNMTITQLTDLYYSQ